MPYGKTRLLDNVYLDTLAFTPWYIIEVYNPNILDYVPILDKKFKDEKQIIAIYKQLAERIKQPW